MQTSGDILPKAQRTFYWDEKYKNIFQKLILCQWILNKKSCIYANQWGYSPQGPKDYLLGWKIQLICVNEYWIKNIVSMQTSEDILPKAQRTIYWFVSNEYWIKHSRYKIGFLPVDGFGAVDWLVGLDNLLEMEWSRVGVLTPESVGNVDLLGVAIMDNCLIMTYDPKLRYLWELLSNKEELCEATLPRRAAGSPTMDRKGGTWIIILGKA